MRMVEHNEHDANAKCDASTGEEVEQRHVRSSSLQQPETHSCTSARKETACSVEATGMCLNARTNREQRKE